MIWLNDTYSPRTAHIPVTQYEAARRDHGEIVTYPQLKRRSNVIEYLL